MRFGRLAIVVLTFGIVGIPAVARAQGITLGYVFTGPVWESGDARQAFTFGGGGEIVTGWKGTKIGLQAEHLWFPATETDGWFLRPISAGVVSIDLSRHFNQSSGSGRWQPFLTGGVFIAASGDAADGGFTIGAGVDRWFTQHTGLRIDVRDQFLPNSFSIVGVRVGIVFR
jgi:hypothetical protein